jgi:branched-chain amino acid transport system permease protein
MQLVSRVPLASRVLIAVALALGVGWTLSALLPGYLVYLAITAIVAALALAGLGIVTGSAGMIALCQLTFAAIGAAVVSWLNLIGAPGGFLLWLVAGSVGAAAVGVIIGLPALRLRGVNLAVVTLGFAAAADATLIITQFPGTTDGIRVLRPELFANDRLYLFFVMLVFVVVGVILWTLQRSRIGSGWRSVAFSERGTAALGGSVRIYKLLAFAVSAAVAGLTGGLIVGQVGIAYPAGFTTLQSLALYVLAIVGGSQFLEMALFGGILWVLVPEVLKRLEVPQDWAFILFGVGGIQALTSGSSLGETIRSGRRANRRVAGHAGLARTAELEWEPRDPLPADAHPALRLEGVSVSFGEVHALRDVDLTVPPRSVVGLIGPNGAGKSTLVDAASGFLSGATGTVSLDGERVDHLPPHRRARAGLRRTFQQDRTPPGLTVGRFVRFAARGASNDHEIRQLLEFFGCPPVNTPISRVDVGTRRLVEIAAQLAARPRVLLLDEPAAGLSHDEHAALGQRLRQVPEAFGCSILLIDHDLDLVRTVCSSITVLNFGEVLTSGPQEAVLADPRVLAAYLGDSELS